MEVSSQLHRRIMPALHFTCLESGGDRPPSTVETLQMILSELLAQTLICFDLLKPLDAVGVMEKAYFRKGDPG